MTEEGFARRVTKLGALADPIRRALYRFVSDQPEAVSRDQAAQGVEVPRHTAKFHLDRLVEEGLLITEFRRLTGRTGPGAGRPAKLYRRAQREVSVSLPSRRYDLAGQVLADAAERALAGMPMAVALDQAAEAAGSAVAAAAGEYDDPAARLADALGRLGYEPRIGDGVTLGNCPYDRLAAEHTTVVCGLNETFVRTVVAEVGCPGKVERRDGGPAAGGCCIRVSAP